MSGDIQVLYFASLAETLACQGERLALPAGVTRAGELKNWLAERGSPWTALLDKPVLVAVNQSMVNDDHAVMVGDEVAFFPPVTGG